MNSAYRQVDRRRSERRTQPQRGPAAAFALVLAMILATFAIALPLPMLGGSSIASAAIQRAKSFVDLMHQRSPGKRLVGQLATTKHKRLAVHERALPKIRKHPREMAAIPPFPAQLPPALVDLVAPPLALEMANLEFAPVGPFGTPANGPPGFYLPPSGGSILPPLETPSSPSITPPVVLREAVPEPSAWTLMLLGFGLVGLSLRRGVHREQITA